MHGRGGSVRAYALIDDEDFDRLGWLRWSLHSEGYAYRQVRVAERQHNVLLHREIAGLEPGDEREVDHRNRNRLDCRRDNLRVVPKLGNRQNLASHGGTSRFRGVHRQRDRWRAALQVGGTKINVGLFTDELEAAIAVDERRRELMPFALPDPELERALEELRAVV